eukprot:TRINITY_DN2590_c0_g1_i1.p1 TRINITY_DN2590_c0_g1~~TRINITY_DN2590_c0_g1_i1.p1  ORF type:complete len:543 (-),score=67.07 TRINITY_DN2590_c0_g1_i1:51-1679(-)
MAIKSVEEERVLEAEGVVISDLPRSDAPIVSENYEEILGDPNKYPSSVKFIMVNEVCERFSFYGLRAILALYLTRFMGFTEDKSTVVVHAFTMAAYATPLLGGWISDTYLGKYRTILYVSFIYCLGSIALATTAIPGVTGYDSAGNPHWWGILIGLSLIALGTGGIKPVVSTFLGDQFASNQGHLLTTIFHIFYFCINLGSVFSTILTPYIRSKVSYAVAFAMPAGLLLIATLIFFLGRKLYKIQKPTGSILWTSFHIILIGAWAKTKQVSMKIQYFFFHCLRPGLNDRTHTTIPNSHWLDAARGLYPKHTVDDVRSVVSVLVVFIPLPFFWSIFDQHSSRWVFQAERMNRHIFGGYEVEPDQMPALNPFLVLLLVPIFDRGIYKAFDKCRFPLTPLKRMSVGMFIASLSFVYAGFLQLALDRSEEPLSIVWQLPQYLILTIGEIMISITGLEFAYTQSPKTMKSLVMATWLLTVSIGNLLVVVIAEIGGMAMWLSFFFFAGLMFVSFIVFVFIAVMYTYKSETPAPKDDEEEESLVGEKNQ